MASFLRPNPGLVLVLLLIGTSILTFGEINGEDGIEVVPNPEEIRMGKRPFIKIEPAGLNVIEVRYPGVERSWIFIASARSKDTGIYHISILPAWSGTKILYRPMRFNDSGDIGKYEPVTDWSSIRLTGWVDEDGDGLNDQWEKAVEIDSNDPNEDLDGDGLTLLQEMYYITDPNDVDSDDDSMDDAYEVNYGTIPAEKDVNDDPDGDGWSNIQEWSKGTDPRDSSDHPDEPPVTPWYWIVIIFAVLFLILGYFIKQLFSRRKLEDDLDDFDRNASRPARGKDRDISGKI